MRRYYTTAPVGPDPAAVVAPNRWSVSGTEENLRLNDMTKDIAQLRLSDRVTTSGEPMSPRDRNAVIREYGKLAPRYDRRWSFYIDATVSETLRRLDVQPDDRLLDVGCGTGALLDALATAVPGATLSGVDATSDMLDLARQRLGEAVVLRQGSVESLPFPDHAFDVVVSTNAFHYFREPVRALEEMVRVLRPSGLLVITDWCHDYLACRLCDLWLRAFDRAHFRTYGQKECRHLLEQAGLVAVRIDRYKITWLWGLMTAVGQKRATPRGDATAPLAAEGHPAVPFDAPADRPDTPGMPGEVVAR